MSHRKPPRRNPSLQELDRELCRRDFATFVRAAWPLVDARPLMPSLALDAVVRHLQAAADGELRRVVCNISPGSSKSRITSVLWPAWLWLRRPELKVMSGCYSATLAERDAVYARNLITSDWYRSLVGGAWALSDAVNTKTRYANTAGGERVCVSPESAVTGWRADVILVDDPQGAHTALSQTVRESTQQWFDTVLASRFSNPAEGVSVVISQRLHSADLSATLVETGYEHLCIPSRFEPGRRCVTRRLDGSVLWEDPRTEEGELAFPALQNEPVLADLEKRMGRAAFRAQYQQDPCDYEGGLFPRPAFRWYKREGARPAKRPDGCNADPAVILPARFTQVVGSVDCTFKASDGSDFVVMQVWGAAGADRFLLGQVRKRMTFMETEKNLLAFAAAHPQCKRWVVEAKANGDAIIDRLKRVLPGITPFMPKESKEARAAAAISPPLDAGQVYLPEGVPWVADYVEELASFPKGRHDDCVDATSIALHHLANNAVARFLAMTTGAAVAGLTGESGDDGPARWASNPMAHRVRW